MSHASIPRLSLCRNEGRVRTTIAIVYGLWRWGESSKFVFLGRKTESFIFAAESNFDAICFKSRELPISEREMRNRFVRLYVRPWPEVGGGRYFPKCYRFRWACLPACPPPGLHWENSKT